MEERYPGVHFEVDRIYQREGGIYIDLEVIASNPQAARSAIKALRRRFREYHFIITYKELL
jgi:hypothetical protein